MTETIIDAAHAPTDEAGQHQALERRCGPARGATKLREGAGSGSRRRTDGQVRDDWESIVIRRVAQRVTAVLNAADDRLEERFGWEGEGLRRLFAEVEARSANQVIDQVVRDHSQP